MFAASLKDVPKGSFTGTSIEKWRKFLTYEENTRRPNNDNLCLFRALDLHLHGNQRLQEENSKDFNSFITRKEGLSPNQFIGVHMINNPVVEDLITLNILLYDIDIGDRNIVGELARGSVQKNENEN